MISVDRLIQLGEDFGNLSVGVLGDFALDLYLDYVGDTGELSLETGRPVEHGQAVRTSPGGAGNVGANAAVLGPASIRAFGLVGDDMLGRELAHTLSQRGIDTGGLVRQAEGWTTVAYIKPLLRGVEQNRLDYGNSNVASGECVLELVERLNRVLRGLDVLIVNEQFPVPLLSDELAAELFTMLTANPEVTVVADCRKQSHVLPPGVGRKLTAGELAQVLDLETLDPADTAACRAAALEASKQLFSPVIMTRADLGMIVAHEEEVWGVPGVALEGPVDPVGAGDTTTAVLALAKGAGATWQEAAEMANLAAAVTVRKLNQTGTATLDEIIACRQEIAVES